MSQKLINTSAQQETVPIRLGSGGIDHIFLQPRGRLTLEAGQTVDPTLWDSHKPHLLVDGKPVIHANRPQVLPVNDQPTGE